MREGYELDSPNESTLGKKRVKRELIRIRNNS